MIAAYTPTAPPVSIANIYGNPTGPSPNASPDSPETHWTIKGKIYVNQSNELNFSISIRFSLFATIVVTAASPVTLTQVCIIPTRE